jgi:bis(5'-nucleosidyl)-tetraphosphatase
VNAQSRLPRLSAGIVVLRRSRSGWHTLVLRVYRNWDLPKGRVEPGEDPLAAALRETAEETGLTGLDFRWGRESRDTEPYAGGKVVRCFLAQSQAGTAALPINPDLGRPEHHEVRWVKLSEARRLLPPRFLPILDWAEATVCGERERRPGAEDQPPGRNEAP